MSKSGRDERLKQIVENFFNKEVVELIRTIVPEPKSLLPGTSVDEELKPQGEYMERLKEYIRVCIRHQGNLPEDKRFTREEIFSAIENEWEHIYTKIAEQKGFNPNS